MKRSHGSRKVNFVQRQLLPVTSGVGSVWVIDPDARTVTVDRSPDEGRLLWNDANSPAKTCCRGK